jgi:hypothetical protein
VQEAAKAVKEMDNHRLDKLHLVRCYLVDDLDRLKNVAEAYEQPALQAFDPEVRLQPLKPLQPLLLLQPPVDHTAARQRAAAPMCAHTRSARPRVHAWSRCLRTPAARGHVHMH